MELPASRATCDHKFSHYAATTAVLESFRTIGSLIMVLGARSIAWIVTCAILISACLVFREIEVVRYPDKKTRLSRLPAAREDYGPDVEIKPYAKLPNEGRRGGESNFKGPLYH